MNDWRNNIIDALEKQQKVLTRELATIEKALATLQPKEQEVVSSRIAAYHYTKKGIKTVTTDTRPKTVVEALLLALKRHPGGLRGYEITNWIRTHYPYLRYRTEMSGRCANLFYKGLLDRTGRKGQYRYTLAA